MSEPVRLPDIPGNGPPFYMVVADSGPLDTPFSWQTLTGVESLRSVSRLLGVSDSWVIYPYQPIKYLAFDSEQDRARWTRNPDGSPAQDRLPNQVRGDGD
jgi:hypothetical protein